MPRPKLPRCVDCGHVITRGNPATMEDGAVVCDTCRRARLIKASAAPMSTIPVSVSPDDGLFRLRAHPNATAYRRIDDGTIRTAWEPSGFSDDPRTDQTAPDDDQTVYPVNPDIG